MSLYSYIGRIVGNIKKASIGESKSFATYLLWSKELCMLGSPLYHANKGL